ncbi:biliverdin-producing heme oxygenase [Acuticoccus sediminis]|uniref:biliverdin-producing heme oxygenase n=1 Tax=Acuticoccus sediminis TaxID=2184697 RepID=UPI001CFECA71|nr:biliverdin-producing heme oxygenase [Acuticoccus sediminis]
MLQSAQPPLADSASRVDPADLRWRLRGATAAAHETLDRRFETLADPGDTRAYHAFLRMNHACHALLEAWLAPVVGPARDPAGRAAAPAGAVPPRQPLTAALAADLAALDLAPLPRDGLADLVTALPQGLSEAAGVLYVLDGSRLGARTILKGWARQSKGLPSTVYLTAAAASSGPVFGAFDALCAHIDPADVAQTIVAAQAAFKLFERASALTTQGEA